MNALFRLVLGLFFGLGLFGGLVDVLGFLLEHVYGLLELYDVADILHIVRGQLLLELFGSLMRLLGELVDLIGDLVVSGRYILGGGDRLLF